MVTDLFKKFIIPAIVLLTVFFLSQKALAICPVCTIAVGAGVGFSRWLGIDDLISGIWLGGLIVSTIIWFLNWLDKKQIRFKFDWLVISFLFYLIVITPLYFSGIIGHPFNKFCGLDKIIFGLIFGSLSFLIGFWLNNFLKKKNNGQVFFPFQKVALPILFLIITSLIFYLIISC